jgi:superfamily I DNA/RNA helicase
LNRRCARTTSLISSAAAPPSFARTEIKDIMAYLRLLANPADDIAFLRIVNTPRRREIGSTTLEQLADPVARERRDQPARRLR